MASVNGVAGSSYQYVVAKNKAFFEPCHNRNNQENELKTENFLKLSNNKKSNPDPLIVASDRYAIPTTDRKFVLDVQRGLGAGVSLLNATYAVDPDHSAQAVPDNSPSDGYNEALARKLHFEKMQSANSAFYKLLEENNLAAFNVPGARMNCLIYCMVFAARPDLMLAKNSALLERIVANIRQALVNETFGKTGAIMHDEMLDADTAETPTRLLNIIQKKLGISLRVTFANGNTAFTPGYQPFSVSRTVHPTVQKAGGASSVEAGIYNIGEHFVLIGPKNADIRLQMIKARSIPEKPAAERAHLPTKPAAAHAQLPTKPVPATVPLSKKTTEALNTLFRYPNKIKMSPQYHDVRDSMGSVRPFVEFEGNGSSVRMNLPRIIEVRKIIYQKLGTAKTETRQKELMQLLRRLDRTTAFFNAV